MDLCTPISFLCTRVSKSTDEDWEKLRQILQYVKGTIGRILGGDDLEWLITYPDAAYAVHIDTRGHTGGAG